MTNSFQPYPMPPNSYSPPQGYAYPPPPQVPVFQVTAMTHIGAVIFWFNHRQVIQGTFQECATTLRAAQVHNLAFGWWSIASILVMNWIALGYNARQKNKLDRDAQNAKAYAEWWYRYIGQGHPQGY